MGNPSDWISELKWEAFGVFEIFFWKIIDFRVKNEKKNFLIIFDSECPETDMSHKLLLFLLYKLI